MSQFVHLRAHSQYSFIDGLLSPEDLVGLAAADGQEAIALTDNQRMFGTIEFYKAARAKGVKPIIGLDTWVDPDITRAGQEDPQSPVRLLLLAKDEAGYRRLMELVSQSYTENKVNGLARIKQSWLAQDASGLVALSGGEDGEIAQDLLSDDPGVAVATLKAYREWFGEDFMLEVQRAGLPNEDRLVPALAQFSQDTGVPLVATHPIQFGKREDYFIHEVKTCIASGDVVGDVNRQTPFTREQHFMDTAQMRELFSDLPQAVDNAIALSRRLSSTIELGKAVLPHFPTQEGRTEDEEFFAQAREGLELRMRENFPDEAERAREMPKYQARLEEELGIIANMGFSGYYLIVSDFIKWAKDNSIPVGPGRGSGAGSLAAYSLKITDIDPLPYDLLFERFLNPERVSMPDFDIDFCMDRRQEVVDYVRARYGEQAVGQISTYGTLKARAAIRDASHALGLPYMLSDSISKLVPKRLEVTLDDAINEEPRLRARMEESEDVARLIRVAKALEDKPRSVGTHAAGVVIAPGKLTDFTPLYLDDPAGGAASQYDKDDVEKAGLVKFDFLGLATLTATDESVRLVNQLEERAENPLDISKIPLDDKKTYELLGQGNTIGVFQFESGGMQGYIKKLQPSNFEDLIALAALYRPGPLGSGMVDDFIDRRHGRQPVVYPHADLEQVLSPTYGVIVYQEQVMQIAQVMAGYTLGQADLLRRAMGKKKPEEMAKERAKFESGAAKKGYDPELARSVFDLMEKFAEYGFNKSHSAAYALIAYQTAYLKAHYPAQFYAGALNIVSEKTDKVRKLVADARKNGINILPPDVNNAGARFKPAGTQSLQFSLTALKGLGAPVARSIEALRQEQGQFTSFFDFCAKVNGSKVNKRAIEALVRAGAFDQLHTNRAAVMEAVKTGQKYASDLAKVQARKQESLVPELFDSPKKKKAAKPPKEVAAPQMPETSPWSPAEQLENERISIGYYVSGHPFDNYRAALDGITAGVALSDIDARNPGEYIFTAGLVTSLKVKPTRKRENMAFIEIDDGHQGKEVVLFPKTWEKCADWIKEGAFISMEAKVEEDTFADDGSNKLIAEKVFDFSQTQQMLVDRINVAIRKPDLPRLDEIVEQHQAPQGQGTQVSIYMPENNDRYYRADIKATINPTPAALSALRNEFGADKVKLGYSATVRYPPESRKPAYSRGGPRR